MTTHYVPGSRKRGTVFEGTIYAAETDALLKPAAVIEEGGQEEDEFTTDSSQSEGDQGADQSYFGVGIDKAVEKEGLAEGEMKGMKKKRRRLKNRNEKNNVFVPWEDEEGAHTTSHSVRGHTCQHL